jgi:3-dehydroquinate dehydratase/shikimate dehydrogenase
MAKICLCLTAKTIARDLEILEKNRKYLDLAELRVDCLEENERLAIRRFPELAGLPVILTIRRQIDGGYFNGGEGARVRLLAQGLAFAEPDPRLNFAYVDLEDDLDVPSLEEAARTFGTRVIRSCHHFDHTALDFAQKMRSLCRIGDEIVKIATMPQNAGDVARLVAASRDLGSIEKIFLCMGSYGGVTRILAEKLGSLWSYTTAMDEPDSLPAAPGQFTPQELIEKYRFREIGEKTRVFGIAGYPLTVTASPAFFNTVFTQEGIDAVYVPLPTETLDAFPRLLELLHIEGVSVTVPHKEKIIPYLRSMSDTVRAVGACNTIVKTQEGWRGYNTDTQGFSDSLLAFIKRTDLKGRRVTIIGAGGAARAVAAEVFRLRGKALILNRTPVRAWELASRYRFLWSGLDEHGIKLMERFGDIIIQTSNAGMPPHDDEDPLEPYQFTGRETVMDLIYHPERTRFLRRAGDSGCAVLNGHDMLIRQAIHQFTLFLGREFPEQFMSRNDLRQFG